MLRRVFDRFEETFIAYLLAAMTIVTFSQVVARYVFNSGAVWALELTTSLFAWLVLFGMSYGIKQGTHLGVDAFVRVFPERIQRALALVVVGLCLAYALILLTGAWDYWYKIYHIGIATEDLYVPRVIVELFGAGDYEEVPIPRAVPYAILPLGLALLAVRVVQAGVEIVRGRRTHITASHEAEDLVQQQLNKAEDPGGKSAHPNGR